MKPNHRYRLRNGDQVVIKEQLSHYQTQQIDYLINDQNGQNYIISQHEFQRLLVRQRTTSEKLALYSQYFSGRSDVYAQKWSNGKGYSPALKNWWAFYQTRHDKDAQNHLTKEYAPYTNQVIYDQITSNDQYHHYGIYPLLDDDCTRLLVFDFDKHGSPVNPTRITQAVLDTCRKYHVSCLSEVSSSGNSYHVWFFFSQPIKAQLARSFGKLILIETMLTSDDVDITCFDRMVPGQDRLPKKGFGNLIALPLKWSEVQSQRSTFVDERLQPLPPDQLFDRLANTKRYSAEELMELINMIVKDMQLLPGQNRIPNLSDVVDYPASISGYIAGEIFIERQKLTRREQLSLLGLATFNSPEFIKKQRMRAPVWNVPSTLTAGRIDGSYIRLPRGVFADLQEHCICHLRKQFSDPPKLKVSFKGELRTEQSVAVRKIGQHHLGMICAHTGFGKTVVGCALIAERSARTLIIVPTTNIAKQWQEAGMNFLVINDSPFAERTKHGRLVRKRKVEVITGARNHPSKLVDVVNIRKLTRMNPAERTALFQDYEQVIVDECHHISATTFEKVLVEANVHYIVGLTATPERNDGLEQFMHYRCGPIYYQGSEEEDYLIHRYLYPRYTNFGEEETADEAENYPQRINHLAENAERNQLIANDVKHVLAEKRHVLLLSERVKHLKELRKLLLRFVNREQLCLVTGSGNSEITIKNQRAAYIILSTSKYVGEGFDMSSLDTLFLTMPFSWRGNTKQYLGRLERGLADKDELRVYDYVDLADDTFAKMYQKRMRVYRKLGYEFVKSKKWNRYDSAYYTSRDYMAVWRHDLEQSTVVYMRLKHLTAQQVSLLNELAQDGKKVYLETVEEQPTLVGQISVRQRRVGTNLCIFDYRTCWYGDLNFGGKSYPNASGIRLVSQRMAKKSIKGYDKSGCLST